MKKIRIGKEFSVRWGLVLNGLPAELDKMDVKVVLTLPFGNKKELSYTADRNILVIPVGRNVQPMTGAYSLSLWINKDKDGQTVVDCSPAFCLVSSTDEESCAQVQAIKEVLDLGTSEIQLGVQGKSAYQTWLDEGNEGTEQDFLNWLRQPSTEAGTGAQAAAAKATEAAGKADKAAGAANTAAAEAVRIATTSAAQSEQRVTTAIEGLNQSVSQAEQKVSEAVLSAKQEVSQAVDSANTSVNEAVSKATEATSAAESAAESATASSAKAEASSTKADASKAEADKASESARTATQEAHAAKQGADAAAQSATEAAGRAEAAAQSVNTAISNASAATDKANASSAKADSSAAKADTAASRATTAAVSAESSSQKAESSSVKADASAKAADAAAATIDNKITDIREEVQNMKNEGNALAGDVSVGKQQIADAITKKGVPTKSTDSFAKMSENIGKIYKGAYDDSFAIFIDFTNPSPEVERIGSAAFPNWLEESVQNIMVKDGKINYNLNRKNSLQKDTGLPAVIDGSDGDILNDWPRFWYSPVLTDNGLRITFSNIPQYSEGWIESRRKWPGATEMVVRNHGGTQTAHSCYNLDPEYRGGNGSNWDSLPKSLLGMPKTQMSHDGMRNACVNKGNFDTGDYHNWDYELYVKANLMFMCIFGTRNWQAEFAGYNPETGEPKRNADGFRYGGLGRGIVDEGAWWNGFNGHNPFLRTNIGLELGCGSGVVDYNLNIGSEDLPNVKYLHVPVFCGVVNPFGHIWKAMDGLTKSIELADGGKQEVWGIFTNPKRYASAGIDGATKVVRKTAVLNNGFLSKIDEDLLPTEVKGNESSHFCDYYYINANPGRYSLWLGGSASNGGHAGGWCVSSDDGVGDADPHSGGRLCFTPS